MSGVTRKPVGYTVLLENGPLLSPADATTYYAGSLSPAGSTANTGQRRMYIPKSGFIRAVYLFMLTGGTLGSDEVSTMSIRVNNTTDYEISAAVKNDAVVTIANNAALAIPVSAGNYIELKWVTPTWVTNPTSVRYSANVYIEG